MMKQKVKILWFDRSIKDFHLQDLLMSLKHVEITTCDTSTEASVLLKANKFNLIISGNHDDDEGLRFFDSLNTAAHDFQFLLFTANIFTSVDRYLMIKGFNYLSKHDLRKISFEDYIEGLINKSFGINDIHLRLKALRDSLDLTQSQFGAAIGISKEDVVKYEMDPLLPTRIVVAVCNHFNLSLALLESLPLNLFIQKLKDRTVYLDQAN